MEAQTLKCPMCGAPAPASAVSCDHCGARLATVACPSCFAMMFIGQQYCPHCGAMADRHESAAPDAPELCPRCQVGLEAVVVGTSKVRECPRCSGIWADAETFRQICADQEKQAAVLGLPSHIPPNAGQPLGEIRYLHCPVCRQLMNRVNFAGCSGVIVDVCRQHGSWFDPDDLHRIVEFIRAGGLDKARAMEMADLEEQRRRARTEIPTGGQVSVPYLDGDARGLAVSVAVRALFSLLG